MKHTLALMLIGIIVLGSLNCNAQKDSRESTEVAYTLYPKFPLESKELTYKIVLDNPYKDQLNIDEIFINEIDIQGLTKSENPDRIVKLEVYQIEDTAYVYNKSIGNSTPSYTWQVRSAANIRVYVTDPTDNSEYYKNTLNSFSETFIDYKSKSSFSNEAEAKKDMSGKYNAISVKHFKDLAENIKKLLPKALNDMYGTQLIVESQPYWTIGSKQFDYSDLVEANKLYLSSFEARKAGNEDEAVSLLKNYIEKLKALIAQYNPNDRKVKYSVKNVDALYLNAALASIFFE